MRIVDKEVFFKGRGGEEDYLDKHCLKSRKGGEGGHSTLSRTGKKRKKHGGGLKKKEDGDSLNSIAKKRTKQCGDGKK